jgi:ATP-binding cassette, subfamily C (CFTR/MRP), member 1
VQLIILCVIGKYLAATIPVLAITLFFVQSYYLRTSRQVRLIDIEVKAPLYKHFIETSHGVSTIRALGWRDEFHERLAEALDQAQRPFYMLFCIQQWLQLVLDLIIAALAVILISIATAVTGSLSPGALGVALIIVLQFNSGLSQTIQAWTKLETSIGAVARVQQFVQETPAEPAGIVTPAAGWPSRGCIHFHNAVATYG